MFETFIIRTNSMKPTLNKGDFITGETTSLFYPGDVVYFSTDSRKNIIHRLVARLPYPFNNYFLEKGDAVNTPGFIHKKQIKGKIIYPHINYKISKIRQTYYIFRWFKHLFNNKQLIVK